VYDTPLTPGYDLSLSFNGVYRSAVKMQLAPTLGSASVLQSSSYGILNASAAVSHQAWRATAYVTNLLDKQEILVPPNQGTPENNLSGLANDYVVNPPREVGLRVAYSF
jgi:outer membrane receptor protein involved in Fe transport